MRLTCSITVGELHFDFVHEVQIESDWQKFTDTATITLPRRIRVLSQGTVRELPELIGVGDGVTIRYGYDGQLRTEFSGFVSALKPGTPFSIECEDMMWALKRVRLPSKSWRSVTLRQLLEYVRDESGLTFDIEELGQLTVGKYLINQATGAQVFDDLKKRFGLRCFFRAGKLVAGQPYNAQTAAEHAYDFRRNIISSDLLYTRADDVALHFRAISPQPNGKPITVDETGVTKTKKAKGDTTAIVSALSAGLGKGELRTLYAPPGLNKEQLLAWLQQEKERLQFDGYRGGLTSFGVPAAEHGDVAALHDSDYPERSGRYYIDSVKKTFGVGGSRREIKLGPKA